MSKKNRVRTLYFLKTLLHESSQKEEGCQPDPHHLCPYTPSNRFIVEHAQSMNHISLRHGLNITLNVTYVKSHTVQDMFRPIPGLISCTVP